jgi:hypothetical protein
MNFLLGLALLILLIPFNRFALKMVPKISPLASQAILFFMLFGNLIIALGWGYGLRAEVTNMNSFIMGIGLACVLNMGYKITYLLVFNEDNK